MYVKVRNIHLQIEIETWDEVVDLELAENVETMLSYKFERKLMGRWRPECTRSSEKSAKRRGIYSSLHKGSRSSITAAYLQPTHRKERMIGGLGIRGLPLGQTLVLELTKK